MCAGCCFVMLAVTVPRIAFVLMWIFTDYVQRAFNGFVLPLLGLIFLPFTTLVYVLVYTPTGISVWGWFFLVFAFIVDIGSYGASAYKKGKF